MGKIVQINQDKKYEIRLSGSIVNLVLFAIVSFLRERKFAREIATSLGVLVLFIGAAAYVFPIYEFNRFSLPLLGAGFGLILSAVLAGKYFDVYVGDPPEVEERKQAEETFKDSKDPYSSLEIDSKRLSEYYAINQDQARGSFRWAVFAMFCGLTTIVAGVWIFYINPEDKPDTFLTSLTTAAGIVVNAISGLYLYLHNKTQKRSLFYYNQLVRIQQIGLSIKLAESHTSDLDKTKAKDRIIDEMLLVIKETSILDSKEVARETVGQ